MSVLYEVFAGCGDPPKFFESLHEAKPEARELAKKHGVDVGVDRVHYSSLTKKMLIDVLNGDGWVENRDEGVYVAHPRRGSRAASE